MAVTMERENIAKVEEMRARFIEAEAQIPFGIDECSGGYGNAKIHCAFKRRISTSYIRKSIMKSFEILGIIFISLLRKLWMDKDQSKMTREILSQNIRLKTEGAKHDFNDTTSKSTRYEEENDHFF